MRWLAGRPPPPSTGSPRAVRKRPCSYRCQDRRSSSLPSEAARRHGQPPIREGTLALRLVIDVGATYGSSHQADNGRKGDDEADDPHGGREDADAAAPRLAAMEEAVRPAVMETLDRIAAAHAKLRRFQENRVELARTNQSLAASQANRRRRVGAGRAGRSSRARRFVRCGPNATRSSSAPG